MAESIPQLEERLTFLFHRIASRIAGIGNMHFRKHALNHYSARILVLLLKHKELRTGELVELLLLPQSTISTHVLALNKRKLISRRRSEQDERSVIVSLTPAGVIVAKDCDELSLRVHKELSSLFPKAALKEGRDFLRKVESRLAELEGVNLYEFHE